MHKNNTLASQPLRLVKIVMIIVTYITEKRDENIIIIEREL